MEDIQWTKERLGTTGQIAELEEIEQLAERFENILKSHGVRIESGSELESACFSIIDVLGKKQKPASQHPLEDIREAYTDILGIWAFMTKIVRHATHPSFPKFVPHLELLNQGTVGQNSSILSCQHATNKIFELLFALVLADLSDEVEVDNPSCSKGDNPDILANIDGKMWGFACKTLYGASGKTLFDNIKKGVDQIERAPTAEIGIVVVNFRNVVNHELTWPLLNEIEFKNGKAPIIGAFFEPERIVPELIMTAMNERFEAMFREVGETEVIDYFSGRKALPGLLAYAQTSAGKVTEIGPIPTSVTALRLKEFGEYAFPEIEMFQRMNSALHEQR